MNVYDSPSIQKVINESIQILECKDHSADDRAAAATIIGSLANVQAIEPLGNALKDLNNNDKVRCQVAKALGEICKRTHDKSAVSYLCAALNDPNSLVCQSAILALKEIDDDLAIHTLHKLFEEKISIILNIVNTIETIGNSYSLTKLAIYETNVEKLDIEIKRALNSIKLRNVNKQTDMLNIDFAILTAIETEREAICKVLDISSKDRIRKDARTYWRKRISLQDGKFYEIVVAQSLDKANVNAALLANDTLHHWKPAAVLLVGIAAAAEPGQNLGDLVIGKEVYYYETGKITSAGKIPEPKQIPVDATLLDRVQALPKYDFSILVERPDGTNTRPKIEPGVIASGDKVIADAEERDAIIAPNRKILAIEMEGYGIIAAAWQSFEQVRCLVIRSLCDYADSSKNDQWHAYAAAVAAGFTKYFLLDEPLDPKNPPGDAYS